MKAILMSIQPKWCELIASGKKTVEIRKTKPKLETPFKVYIYCTKGETGYLPKDIFGNEPLNGKVIGEFVCNDIETLKEKIDKNTHRVHLIDVNATRQHTQMEPSDLWAYIGKSNGYAWHISNLVIYDKPKELSEFSHTKKYIDKIRNSVTHWEYGIDDEVARMIRKPPQSWCYVEEVTA